MERRSNRRVELLEPFTHGWQVHVSHRHQDCRAIREGFPLDPLGQHDVDQVAQVSQAERCSCVCTTINAKSGRP